MQIDKTKAKEAARKAEAEHKKARTWTGLDWTGRTGTGTTITYGRIRGSPDLPKPTTLRTPDGSKHPKKLVHVNQNENVQKVPSNYMQKRGFFNRKCKR